MSSYSVNRLGEILATRTYLGNWKNSEDLARYFLSITPQNYIIHGSSGEALYKNGNNCLKKRAIL